MLSLYLVPDHTILSLGTTIRIEGDEAHHIVRVARHRIGERIWISDGAGHGATATILSSTKDSVDVRIDEVSAGKAPAIRLRIIQGLTKSDRAHECIELLVAAGVDEIVPWSAERSIGKWDSASSHEKWMGWIRSAVKQTRRDRIPHLAPLLTELSIDSLKEELILVFDEDASETLDRSWALSHSARLDALRAITLVIGPEGGLSDAEIERLKTAGAMVVRLGLPILRSAHAGAIALAAVQASLSIWR